MPAPLKPKPGFTSLLISTDDIIVEASNPHPNKLLPSAYNAMKLCQSGITPSGLKCRVILAWSLRPWMWGVSPIAIAVNPVTNKIYISNYGSGGSGTTMTVINAANNNATTTVPVGSGPFDLDVNMSISGCLCVGRVPSTYLHHLFYSAGAYPIRAGSLVLGVTICAFYFYMAKAGCFHRNPTIGYSVLFLFLSAVLVTGFRFNFGIGSSIDSRYTIYSTLLLIFGWFLIVEEWLITKMPPAFRNRILVIATASAILFSVTMDVWGFLYLRKRNRDLVIG